MQSKRRMKTIVGGGLALSLVWAVLGSTCFPAPLPIPAISFLQLFNEAPFSVALSVDNIPMDPADLEKVNWVFGDGTGFVEGPAGRNTITHRYRAAGDFEVSAFVFDATGLIDQIDAVITVVDDGNGPAAGLEIPGLISGPDPSDGAEDVDVTQVLSWTAGSDAASHDVYLGTDEDAVLAAGTSEDVNFRGNFEETEFDPMGLMPDTDYFWRVDELNAIGITKGEVMHFRTAVFPGAAEQSIPANGVSNARVDTVLRWTAGDGVTSHDVYFGDVLEDVLNATEESDEIFKGNQEATTFDPEDEATEIDGQLLATKMYFWRIDERGPGGMVRGEVLEFRTANPPSSISNPTPGDFATGVNISMPLSWLASSDVESYDVYLGTDTAAVDSALRGSPEFEGNQTSKIFDPSPLLGDMTYFWRVDTLGAGGTRKGSVMQFTTATLPQAIQPPFFPADNAANVDDGVILSWIAGAGTTSFDVYFGTSESAVVNGSASAFRGNQDVSQAEFDPNGLNPDTVYFWRVDSVGPGGTTTGPVFSFRVGINPETADNPDPANNERGVPLDVVLTWTGPAGATMFDVYFGDSRPAIENADKDDFVFKGTQPGESFDPAGDLEGNKTYFWRIDSIGTGGTSEGLIWQFTTAPGKAINPQPLSGTTGVALTGETLNWTAGAGATSHDVYQGDSQAAVANADRNSPEFQGNQAGTTFEPDEFDGNTEIFWRVDEVNDDGTTPGDVWHFITAPGKASDPVPANGANNVSLEPTLSWTAGSGSDSHDVYLGVTDTAVREATRGSAEFQGNQNNTDFTPAAPLDGNTVYFWRIDELDSDGNTTTGDIFQFRTQTGKASDPDPEDEATGIDVNADLSWTAGTGASSRDVYFGDDFDAVANATPATTGIFQGNQTPATFDPGVLDAMTTYYWRIDEKGAGGTTKGDIWSFTTGPGLATDPDPADGAFGVNLNPLLSWTPADGALSYDVYFGNSASAVENADRNSPEFQGNQAGTNFSPGILDGLSFHYWRIDARNGEDVTQGDVWQFKTGPGKATNPDPGIFEMDVSVNTLLGWTAGIGAVSHDVYFSTSLADVVNGAPAAFQGNQNGTLFDPGALTGDTLYFWRIDEVAAGGVIKTAGDVWQFTTQSAPDPVGGPNPFNGAIDVAVSIILNWNASSGATSYDVYLSTDETAVTNGDLTALQSNQAATSFNPSPDLTADTQYFWRIDAINDAGTTAGSVWTFTTEP